MILLEKSTRGIIFTQSLWKEGSGQCYCRQSNEASDNLPPTGCYSVKGAVGHVVWSRVSCFFCRLKINSRNGSGSNAHFQTNSTQLARDRTKTVFVRFSAIHTTGMRSDFLHILILALKIIIHNADSSKCQISYRIRIITSLEYELFGWGVISPAENISRILYETV